MGQARRRRFLRIAWCIWTPQVCWSCPIGSASHSPPSPGVPSAKRTREEDGGEEEGSQCEKHARWEEVPSAVDVAEDPQTVETGPEVEAPVAPVTTTPDVTGPAAEEPNQE